MRTTVGVLRKTDRQTDSYMASDGLAAMVIKIDERSEQNDQTTWQ